MTTHVSIEISACANTCDAGILAVGAVAFDPAKAKVLSRFYKEVNPYYGQQGRRFDPKHMLSMVTNHREVARLAAAPGESLALSTVLDELSLWFRNAAGAGAVVWSWESHITVATLDHAYHNNAVGHQPPWSRVNVRDVGTLIALCDNNHYPSATLNKFKGEKSKNAQDDAEVTCHVVCEALAAMKPAGAKKVTPKVVQAVDDDEL